MQQENSRPGPARRLARRLRGRVSTTRPSDDFDAAGELTELRALIAQTELDIETAEKERENLKAERLRLQELLGAQHGKRVLPRLKVEKTNGVPSLVVGARMMQRIHARADDPQAGIDGAGALFADPARTEAFVRSHGVGIAISHGAEPTAVVHAFKGKTPLVELRAGDSVKHVSARGDDLGDIRPGVRYDAAIQVPGWLQEAGRVSRTLSAAISRPYVQIGWRDQDGHPTLTGVDVDPEQIPVMNEEWDQRLGKAFDSGHARMLMQPYTAGALDNRAPDGTFRYEETV